MNTELENHARDMLHQPVHAAISAMASSILARHQPVVAVLAYGSALRDSQPDATLIDFYVLTQSNKTVSSNPLSRLLCRVMPPNVYYAEHRLEGANYRTKYAVLPVGQLGEKLKGHVSNPYFWARFAQPMRLVWAANPAAREQAVQMSVTAMETAYGNASALLPTAAAIDQWTALFTETYKTELRPEDASRAKLIVDLQRQHYEAIARLASPTPVSMRHWSTRRWQGKLLSVGRLMKAAFTFQGGADYAAWKIERHTGVKIEVTPWQRKHPILSAITLLPGLLRAKALK